MISIISVSAFVPKFVLRRNIAMGCKYKLCENSIKAGCFLCTSVIFFKLLLDRVKTGTLERPLANDGSFYTVPVCRRIDDFHFSCGTVSKSKFTSCLIKSTKFEVSFKVLVGKKFAPSNFSSCYFCFSF